MKEEQVRQHKDKIEWAARAGFLAKGIVYIIVAVLALDAAFGGPGEQAQGSKGAIVSLLDEPFGQVLVGLMAVGLLGYAIWKLYQGFMDPEMRGNDAKGLAHRFGYVAVGFVHVGLAVFAASLVLGTGGGGQGGGGTESWIAKLMSQPFGQYLVAAVGAIIIAVSLNEFYSAWTAKFSKKCHFHDFSLKERKAAITSGRVGHAARGVIFIMIGWFITHAAITYDASEAGGMQQALRSLQDAAYGPWLLAIVALGLLAYGAFSVLMTRYRQIQV
jgi:hypothetical protein